MDNSLKLSCDLCQLQSASSTVVQCVWGLWGYTPKAWNSVTAAVHIMHDFFTWCTDRQMGASAPLDKYSRK